MLPSVSGPTSAGPDAYAVTQPRRGSVDELVWESLCYATPTGYRPLFLDLHVPRPLPGEGPPPLVVWVHGGGWESGSRRRFPVAVEEAWFLERLLLAGFAVALVDYRLVREADFPAAPTDVGAAVAWLRNHAENLGYDGGRVVLWGESAGAHLALLTAADATDAHVAAVVDWYGPADLPALASTAVLTPADGATGAHVPTDEEGGEPGFSPDMARVMEERGWGVPESSPVNVLTAACPPVFIAHGRGDTTVPLAQSKILRDHLEGLGVPVELFETAGGHVFEGADVIPEVIARSLDFLARTLGIELGPRRDPGLAGRSGRPAMTGAYPVASVEEAAVEAAPGRVVRLRIQRPVPGSDTVVVYLHGDGLALEEHQARAARLCATVPATVVQVDCGSTDGSFAAAHQDGVAAASWVHGRLDAFGARRMVVAGDGAGGALAFAVALHCRDHGIPVAALLADQPTANGAENRAVVPALGWTLDRAPAELGGLPPVVLGIGAHDPLFEGTLRFVRRLREANVPTRLRIFPTLGHDYRTRTGVSAAADRAVEQLNRDLGQLLWDGILG